MANYNNTTVVGYSPVQLRKSGLPTPVRTLRGNEPASTGQWLWSSEGSNFRATNRSGLALVGAGLVAEREDGRLDPVLEVELGEDTADVGLDRLDAYAELPGDLAIAVTARDEPEHLAFRAARGVAEGRAPAAGAMLGSGG